MNQEIWWQPWLFEPLLKHSLASLNLSCIGGDYIELRQTIFDIILFEVCLNIKPPYELVVYVHVLNHYKKQDHINSLISQFIFYVAMENLPITQIPVL